MASGASVAGVDSVHALPMTNADPAAPALKLALPDANAAPPAPAQSALYFVDIPGARQSEIRIGYVSLSATDPDYYPATVVNDKLGGSFNGVLNLILREEKGFTEREATAIV